MDGFQQWQMRELKIMIENSGSAPMFVHSNLFETILNGAEPMIQRHSESGEQWFTALWMAKNRTFVWAVV